MSDPKGARIEELEKQLLEQKDINAAHIEVIHNWERKASKYEQKIDSLQEQCSIRYEAIERLNGEKKQLEEIIKDRTKDVQHYDAENKKLLEKLDVAENELEKEIRTLNAEIDYRNHLIEDNSNLVRKNDRIVSAVADLFRKIMVD